jgi:GNAT superfamily N-acetyltransferase
MYQLHQEMTWEEYLAFPRKLGWKYEYFGDALHVSPVWTAIATFWLSLDNHQALYDKAATSRRINLSIRPVKPPDFDLLLPLFCECFSDSIDYCDCDSSDLLRYAHKSLDHFFQPTPTEYFYACRAAVEGERIVGCCMIDRGKHGPVLQPIFVDPEYQRRGIGTSLHLDAIQALVEQSAHQLHSRCNLGNQASVAWHLKCGFTEICNRWTAGHRANIYSQEAERQERLQLPTAAAMRELATYWADERERLESDGTIEEF